MAAGDVASVTLVNVGAVALTAGVPANVSAGDLNPYEVASGSATSAELAAFVQLANTAILNAGSAAVEKGVAAALIKDNGALDSVTLTDAKSKHAYRLKGSVDDFVDILNALGW